MFRGDGRGVLTSQITFVATDRDTCDQPTLNLLSLLSYHTNAITSSEIPLKNSCIPAATFIPTFQRSCFIDDPPFSPMCRIRQ